MIEQKEQTGDDIDQNKVNSTPENTQEQEKNANNQSSECKEKDELIRDWENEYNELYDKYIRLYSEFENFRRRTNKEKLDLMNYANANLILDILPVKDDFERALNLMETAVDVNSIKEGIQHIFQKFSKILEDKGLKEIKCIGENFDPEIHEAILKIPAPKKKLKDKIVDQVLKGYYLKDKVIRHSKVVVGE